MNGDFIWMIVCLAMAFGISGYLERRFDARRKGKRGQ